MITLRNIFRVTLLASTVAFAGCGMMPSSMASETVTFGATLSGAAEVRTKVSPKTCFGSRWR